MPVQERPVHARAAGDRGDTDRIAGPGGVPDGGHDTLTTARLIGLLPLAHRRAHGQSRPGSPRPPRCRPGQSPVPAAAAYDTTALHCGGSAKLGSPLVKRLPPTTQVAGRSLFGSRRPNQDREGTTAQAPKSYGSRYCPWPLPFSSAPRLWLRGSSMMHLTSGPSARICRPSGLNADRVDHRVWLRYRGDLCRPPDGLRERLTEVLLPATRRISKELTT